MTYSGKANPNATNSELDAKKIIKFPKLNVAQWETLKEQFVELIVDGMDYKSMEQYVTEQLTNYYDGLSYHELREEVNNHSEELFDELVDNVSTDPLVEEVEQCIIDTNGDYAECVDHLVQSMEETKNA